MLYVSIIHAITCSLVFISGAGMSVSGPNTDNIFAVYLRVIFSSSILDKTFGSHFTAPLAPPKGMFATAHFHVIQAAKALTSSRLTSGEYLMPPFDGPRILS